MLHVTRDGLPIIPVISYRPSQLYHVVSDVDSYHLFLPYCTSSFVLKRHTVKSTEGYDILKMQGELTVGFMGFTESYISDVECRPYRMVQVSILCFFILSNGSYCSYQAKASSETPLFQSLITTWQFHSASSTSPHPSADIESTLHRPSSEHEGPTLVTLDLEYEFSNPLYAQISAAFFGQVSKMMVEAFGRRCLEVYGPGTR